MADGDADVEECEAIAFTNQLGITGLADSPMSEVYAIMRPLVRKVFTAPRRAIMPLRAYRAA